MEVNQFSDRPHECHVSSTFEADYGIMDIVGEDRDLFSFTSVKAGAAWFCTHRYARAMITTAYAT